MKVRDILKRLRNDGWTLANVEGSHHHAFDREGVEIGGGTLKSIFKQAGWNQ